MNFVCAAVGVAEAQQKWDDVANLPLNSVGGRSTVFFISNIPFQPPIFLRVKIVTLIVTNFKIYRGLRQGVFLQCILPNVSLRPKPEPFKRSFL